MGRSNPKRSAGEASCSAEDVNGCFAFLVVPPAPMFPDDLHLRKMRGIVWCCTGAPEEAETATRPIRSFADFVNELSDEAIRLHLKHGSAVPTMHSTMHLYPIDGAVHRVGTAETAFSYRDSRWAMVVVGVDPDPAKKDLITAWARKYWEDLHPYSAGGAYVNFLMEEGDERIRATYRDNYARLAAVKAEYDPGNVFRVNQNVKPARGGAAT